MSGHRRMCDCSEECTSFITPKTIQDHYRKGIFSPFFGSFSLLDHKTSALSMKVKNRKLMGRLSEILNELEQENSEMREGDDCFGELPQENASTLPQEIS